MTSVSIVGCPKSFSFFIWLKIMRRTDANGVNKMPGSRFSDEGNLELPVTGD